MLFRSKKERVEYQRISYESILQVFNALERVCEGENKGQLTQWVVSNLNEMETLFPNKLEIDCDEISQQSLEGLLQPMGGVNEEGVRQKTRSEVVPDSQPRKPKAIKGIREPKQNVSKENR